MEEVGGDDSGSAGDDFCDENLAEGLLTDEGAVGEAGDTTASNGFNRERIVARAEESSDARGEDVHAEWRGGVACDAIGELTVDVDGHRARSGDVERGFRGDGREMEVGAKVVGLGLFADAGKRVDELVGCGALASGPDVLLGEWLVNARFEDGSGDVLCGVEGFEGAWLERVREREVLRGSCSGGREMSEVKHAHQARSENESGPAHGKEPPRHQCMRSRDPYTRMI